MTQSNRAYPGANIGTTVTGWLVAIIGFKFKIKVMALPAIGPGFFIRFLKKENLKTGRRHAGVRHPFPGLTIMSDAVKDLNQSKVIMNFMTSFQLTASPPR
jgi:phosphate:Na+ symporter